MDAFEAYELYVSIKLHFSQKNYDFFKFNGKVNTTIPKFESRPDKSFFFKIANKYSRSKLIDFYVANFVDNPDIWIGDLLDSNSEEIYTEWRKRIESLSYNFSEECDQLLQWINNKGWKFNTVFRVFGVDHPVIVKMALQKVISLESFIILDSLLGFGKNIDKELQDIIWKDFWLKVTKYKPFIKVDLKKCFLILKEKIQKEYPEII